MTDVTLTHEPPATPAPALEPHPEAPASDYPLSTLCLRLDLDGVGLSWTLRGDDSDVASRLPRILDYIKRLQAKLPRPEPTRPVTVPARPLEERPDWCSIHGVAMVQQENSRGNWYSHKTIEGWCKGKAKRAGERAS